MQRVVIQVTQFFSSRVAWQFCLFAFLIMAIAVQLPASARAQSVKPLAGSSSSYLRQHADDPIKWQPWGETAFKRAREEKKLIFLSIGYTSCHWCHRMARDTFSDQRVIKVLNENFVMVLIDREERPDLDDYFMDIMEGMAGHSGWPANFVLTPQRVPVFAVGYLTSEGDGSNPGLLYVTKVFSEMWAQNRNSIEADAAVIRDQLANLSVAPQKGAGSLSSDPRKKATRLWRQSFDQEYGGFGMGPKFHLSNVLSFLLSEGARSGDEALLKSVYSTLDHMAAGGVRDQLGGAFHRYAVDRFWEIPHFEIMLSDNALLALLYLQAYQISKKQRYASIARQILDDLLERFRLDGGGFATALDSDSEEKEGRFYTWTKEEITAVLGEQDAKAFLNAYVDEKNGAVDGRLVLQIKEGPDALEKVQQQFAGARAKLKAARANREKPRRDGKVLTSWNALTISAFVKAARVLGEERYLEVAQKELARLVPQDPENLSHSRLGSVVTKAVFLDDYAYLIAALIDLYEADFDVTHLDNARSLIKVMIKRFQTKPGTPFQFTPLGSSNQTSQSKDTGPLSIPARVIVDEKNAPSGNAVALISLLRLALYGAQGDFEHQALGILADIGRHMEENPTSLTGLLQGISFQPSSAREIVIVGNKSSPDTNALLKEVYERPIQGVVLAVIPPDAPSQNTRWPLLDGRPLIAGKATAYVCKKRLCDLPVNTPEALSKKLDALLLENKSIAPKTGAQ